MKTKAAIGLAATLGLLAVLVVGCGKDFCIMGIGNCDQYKKTQPKPPPGPKLQLSVSSPRVYTTQRVTFTASGGTTPYQFAIIQGGGGIDSYGIYTAPNYPGAVMVQVTDKTGATAAISVAVLYPPPR